jgi:adenine-specific DNA glycosylase
VAVESVMDYPYKVPKKKSREEHVAVCVLTKSKGSATEFLLVQRPEKGMHHCNDEQYAMTSGT